MNVLVIGTKNPVLQSSCLLYYACNKGFDVIVSNADSWSGLQFEDRELIAKYCWRYGAKLFFAGIKADVPIVVGSTNSRKLVEPTVFADNKRTDGESRPSDFAIFQFIERFYDSPLFIVTTSATAEKLHSAKKMVSCPANSSLFIAEPPSNANMPIVAIGYDNDPIPTRYINADKLGLTADSFL